LLESRSSLPLTIILAVGVDSSFLASQRSIWEPAGCYVTSAGSIREAIIQFRDGDFDLILLGDSIPIENQERMTFLIRASGDRIPVVCVTDSPSGHDSFADATIQNERSDLLQVIEHLASRGRSACGRAAIETDGEARPHLLKDVRTLQMLWPRKILKMGGGVR
jgi:hypothetical protein